MTTFSQASGDESLRDQGLLSMSELRAISEARFGPGTLLESASGSFLSSVKADGYDLSSPTPLGGAAPWLRWRFWNATEACCNFWNNPVDDVAYFNASVDDASTRYNVDPHRSFVISFVIGHSNGAFMAHRLACEASDRLGGSASLAGAAWIDSDRGQPTEPVAILQVPGNRTPTSIMKAGWLNPILPRNKR